MEVIICKLSGKNLEISYTPTLGKISNRRSFGFAEDAKDGAAG
jgi:hypothetical protein